jgi:hypothetical protein
MMYCSNVSCADAVDPADFIDLAESVVAALELDPSSAGQDTYTWPPIFEPIYRGDVQELERLLTAPDVVHVSVETGVSSLMLAMSIIPHQLEMVQLLLVDRGCPLEQVTTRAVRYGHVRFKSHWSALMVGCERGALAAVRYVAAAAESAGRHPWSSRVHVGALLVARMNRRFHLVEQLETFLSLRCGSHAVAGNHVCEPMK